MPLLQIIDHGSKSTYAIHLLRQSKMTTSINSRTSWLKFIHHQGNTPWHLPVSRLPFWKTSSLYSQYLGEGLELLVVMTQHQQLHDGLGNTNTIPCLFHPHRSCAPIASLAHPHCWRQASPPPLQEASCPCRCQRLIVGSYQQSNSDNLSSLSVIFFKKKRKSFSLQIDQPHSRVDPRAHSFDVPQIFQYFSKKFSKG